MDENEYRNAYHSLNDNRCVFEKSILTQNCGCQYHEKFNLAEREGIRCTNPEAQQHCSQFLNETRSRARFALHLTQIVGNLLPHNKEIQVQKGALLGLVPDLPNLPDTEIVDIHPLIDAAFEQCAGDFAQFPYAQVMASITHHPPRPKRRRRSKRHSDKTD